MANLDRWSTMRQYRSGPHDGCRSGSGPAGVRSARLPSRRAPRRLAAARPPLPGRLTVDRRQHRPPAPVRATLRLLPRVAGRLTAFLAAGVVATAALPAAFALASGALVGSIADAAGAGFDSPAGRRVIAAGAAAAVLFGARQVSAPALRALAEALGRRLDGHLRASVMAATLTPAGVALLEDPEVLDGVAAAQAVGTGEVTGKEAVAGLAGAAVRLLGGLGSAAVLAAYRWWLAVALVVVYATLTATLTADLRRTISALRGHARRFRRSSYFRELALTAPAAKELRIFGLAGWVGERYADHWAMAMEAFRRDRRRGAWLPPAAALVLVVVQGGTYALLGRSAARGEITLGELAAFATAAAGVAAIFQVGIDDLNIGYGTAPVPAALALEGTAAEPRFHLSGDRPAEGLPAVAIRFEGVGFRYPGGGSEVFSGLDLEIAAGRSLAVVGHNGAGKTTLVKLLARLYDPTEGRIRVDGVELTEIDPTAWQRRIAAIFQDFTHYQLTLADNVGFGALERIGDRPALDEAAARAGLAGVLQGLPEGWDSVLAPDLPGGVDLSGGQWQRVALARALFGLAAGAGILVLDEPTAALDVRAEAAFYDRFLELTAGVTTVVISHRFSTVRRADRIVVVESGRVVEDGDHRSLLEADGRYARMFRLQAAHFAWSEAPGASGARVVGDG